jgi:hypothetical protein
MRTTLKTKYEEVLEEEAERNLVLRTGWGLWARAC